jgi:hypothetical protein
MYEGWIVSIGFSQQEVEDHAETLTTVIEEIVLVFEENQNNHDPYTV